MPRQHLDLPFGMEMKPAALSWAADREAYSSAEITAALADAFALDEEQRTRRQSNGRLAFDNYVDWLLAELTRQGVHKRGPDRLYRLVSLSDTTATERTASSVPSADSPADGRPDPDTDAAGGGGDKEIGDLGPPKETSVADAAYDRHPEVPGPLKPEAAGDPPAPAVEIDARTSQAQGAPMVTPVAPADPARAQRVRTAVKSKPSPSGLEKWKAAIRRFLARRSGMSELPGMNQQILDALGRSGIGTTDDLVELTPEELVGMTAISEEDAEALLGAAQEATAG